MLITQKICTGLFIFIHSIFVAFIAFFFVALYLKRIAFSSVFIAIGSIYTIMTFN